MGWHRCALLTVSTGVLLAACSSSGAVSDFRSSQDRPDVAFIRDGTQLVIDGGSAADRLVWDLANESLIGSPTVIESIEPITAGEVFVGVCCEPTAGRQLIVDLDDGSFEIFPLTVRFPSVGEGERRSVVSGGATIAADDLGAFLAYENGVGVVARGSQIRDEQASRVFRPVAVVEERVVFIDGSDDQAGELVATDLEGVVVASASLEGVRLVDYDPLNDVVVAIVGGEELANGEMVLLRPETLDEMGRWDLPEPVISIDAREGWALFTMETGSVTTTRLRDLGRPDAIEVLVDSGATEATFLR